MKTTKKLTKKRLSLKKRLKKESLLTSETSMEVLLEFEALAK